MNFFKKTKGGLFAAALLSVISQANAQQSAGKLLPVDPDAKTGKLPNGLTYYVRHNQEPKHRVIMYLVNKAGSVLEDEDQRGLAHFMEHMSFNGTTHFPHNELIDYLQKAGVRFGADINAYTSFDETVYQLPLPSDKPDILNKGIEIMHDWAQSATLDADEIDKERGVVLEEKRLGKGAGERMQRQYWPLMLNNSRYAVRIPIGLDTVLNNFKRPAIARFYHDWYRPDLQALIIVGDINADSLVNVIKTKFADLKNPVHERPRPRYTVPLTGKNQFIAVTDKEMPNTVAEIIIKHPGTVVKTDLDYKNEIIRNLFNHMLAERYSELVHHTNPPFISGGGGLYDFTGHINIFGASATAKPGMLQEGFKALWREAQRVKLYGFIPTELERAKKDFQSHVEETLAEKDKTASETYVKDYQELFLEGTAAPGIVKINELTKAYLPVINVADLNNLAKEYITDANRDILILAPGKDKANLPNEATINLWMQQVNDEHIQPYTDNVSTQPLLAGNIVPGKIVKSETIPAVGTTAITLSNGLKVLLKPTDFKNDQILFSGIGVGGTSLAPDADYESAANAAGIIGASGAGNYNADQLAKFMEGKHLVVTPFISDRNQGFSGSSTNKDLETTLQLINAYFTQPRRDESIFKSIIERMKGQQLHRSDDPKSVFTDSVHAILGNYNIRRTGPSIAKLEQVNLDKAYAFYKARFADASNFTFTFVGSIDTNAIKPLLEKYLGSLPATNAKEQAKDLRINIPPGIIAKNVYKGSEPQSTVMLVYSGFFDYNQENKIKLDALKECLEIRLIQRLREDESGVYSPGVFANTLKYPDGRYSLIIQFGCAPQNVDKLVASANDEIAKLRTNGPLQENLDKWRVEDKTNRETLLKTNTFWFNYLSLQVQNNDTLPELNDYAGIRDGITAGQLQKMAEKYLSGKNYIKIVLLPETSAAVK